MKEKKVNHLPYLSLENNSVAFVVLTRFLRNKNEEKWMVKFCCQFVLYLLFYESMSGDAQWTKKICAKQGPFT